MCRPVEGPQGNTVHITVLREGSDKPIDFAVVRDEIPATASTFTS